MRATVWLVPALVCLAPLARAQTAADIAPGALPGKTLSLNAIFAGAPFTGVGGFTITFTGTSFTMPISDGNPAIVAGTYTATQSQGVTVVVLNGYSVNGSTVNLALVPAPTGRGTFEMYAPGVNGGSKSGTFIVSGGSTGGGTTTGPAVTSATTATATVGTPFSYQITTNPVATSYTNSGGNAPVAINPTTGLVTGTFNTAGTFIFSFVALNGTTASAVTTVTVTVSAGSTGGGTSGLGAGLVAYYKFEGNFNDSAGSNHGNAQGGVSFAASKTFNGSNFGQAASFNGNSQFIIVPHDVSLNTTANALTVSLWVNTTNPLASTGGQRLVEKQTYGVADGWNFDTYDISRQSRNVVRLNSTTIGANSSGQFTTGTWQHLAFVYSGGTVTFYINGNTVGTGQVGTLPNNALPLYLGGPRKSSSPTPEFFNGLMDEVRIYNRALTVGEVLNLSEGSQSTTGLGTVVAPSVSAAPTNLVGYRNKVGQIFQFTVTGTNTGAVWGTDVYTDDSSVATAAVHAGVLAVGETKTVTLTVLPGQSSYTSSTRNGVKASSWGAWSGSFSFAGAGAVAGTSVATARPAIATDYKFTTAALAAGGRFVLPINVTGGGTYTYQWYLNNLLISGATTNPYVVESLAAGNAGTYTVDVTNSLGTSRLTAGTITVGAAGIPVIALQPLSKLVSPGGTFILAVAASGTNNSYQWLRNGNSINGETGPYLLRQNASANDAGTYSVRITNSSGTTTSEGGVVTISATASRPANISCRTNIAARAIVTPGFVVQGTGTKNVLIRAVGPTLGGFGVPGVMADPQFKVIRQDTGATIATNDNWDASLANTMAAAGAFALTPGSKDAAAVVSLTAGQAYTVQVSGVGDSSGVALIEVYDVDTAPTSKLVNVSVRGQTGVDADVLILGLVIQGSGQRTLLIRGGGPALAGFGVTGAVVDPKLEVFDSNSRSVLANDDWANASFVAELEQARQFVGAFAYTNGSKDAATLALLDPGAYTIQVSGANRTTGEALVEVYEVP